MCVVEHVFLSRARDAEVHAFRFCSISLRELWPNPRTRAKSVVIKLDGCGFGADTTMPQQTAVVAILIKSYLSYDQAAPLAVLRPSSLKRVDSVLRAREYGGGYTCDVTSEIAS